MFTALLLLSAGLSEPATESGQLRHIALEHAELEPVHQQEPDEERTEAKRCSVSVSFELFATFQLLFRMYYTCDILVDT